MGATCSSPSRTPGTNATRVNDYVPATPKVTLPVTPDVARAIPDSPLHSFPGHTKRMNAVCFSNDDDAIISASDDQSLRVWRQWRLGVSTRVPSVRYLVGSKINACAVVPPPPPAFKKDVAPVPQGALRVVTGSDNGLVEVWDLLPDSMTYLACFRGHTSWVSSVTVLGYFEDEVLVPVAGGATEDSPSPHKTPDPRRSFRHHILQRRVFLRVASGGGDGKVGVWDWEMAAAPKEGEADMNGPGTSMDTFTHALTRHSNWVLSVSAVPPTAIRSSYADAPLHDYVASVCWDRRVRLWHIPSRSEVCCSSPHTAGLFCIAVCPSTSSDRLTGDEVGLIETDATPSVSPASTDGSVTITVLPVSVVKLKPLPSRRVPDAITVTVSPVRLPPRLSPPSPTGLDASSSVFQSINPSSPIANGITGLRAFLSDPAMPVLGAVGTQDGIVMLVNLTSGEVVARSAPLASDVIAVTMSPSGKYVVASSGDGTVRLLSMPSLSVAWTFGVPSSRKALCVALSRSRNYLAVGAADGPMHLYTIPRSTDV